MKAVINADTARAIVDACVDLFHGAPHAAGFMTSGGTESVLMAVKAAEAGEVK